ncbi:hypothetical protein V1283_004690 [Bradyrhizobium sp. AZCC 2262]|uniref:hypothetical protein n=1 Tax=Bradyrhizobium sp. AZCC 2262 TaxID=3117022 RepID=UPI002FF3AB3E
MRDLTMAKGRLDALCHRMKRLESWLVFIDAGHMASDLQDIRSSRCLCILPIFPDFGNSLATFDISFAQGDWSAHAAIAILRSRDVSRFSCSRIHAVQGSSRFPIRIIGDRWAGMRNRLRTE